MNPKDPRWEPADLSNIQQRMNYRIIWCILIMGDEIPLQSERTCATYKPGFPWYFVVTELEM